MDQAYEGILDALCDGTLKPNERFTQEDIAARLNVSRQPVTHALAVLKAQGFLTQAGRRGLTVTPIRPEFFQGIYQLRSVIEPLAVSLATPNLDATAAAKAQAIIERGRKMVANNDANGGLQADIDFHTFIYKLSGNSLLLDTMQLHWHHLRRAMIQVLRKPGISTSVWQEHQKILEAMIAGEAEVGSLLMRRHIIEAFERTGKSTS